MCVPSVFKQLVLHNTKLNSYTLHKLLLPDYSVIGLMYLLLWKTRLLLYGLFVIRELSSQENLGDNEINSLLDLECNSLSAEDIDNVACLFREIIFGQGLPCFDMRVRGLWLSPATLIPSDINHYPAEISLILFMLLYEILTGSTDADAHSLLVNLSQIDYLWFEEFSWTDRVNLFCFNLAHGY